MYLQDCKPAPETIYFGGGTPSILREIQLQQLCDMIRSKFYVSNLREWTVEANPGTLQRAKLAILKAAGVTRISVGAQSFDDDVLQSIGRRHRAADIVETIKAVGAAGFSNIGLDLIACLPGVDEKRWRRTLDEAVGLGAEHLSVYALTVEAGSLFEKRVKDHEIIPAGDDEVLRVLDVTEKFLEKNGYRRYEISNYAKPGCKCLHNLSLWCGGDYIGFGPAAASRDGLLRRTNRADLSGYVAALGAGVKPPCEEETVSKVTDAGERFVFAFRLDEGVDLSAFCSEYEVDSAVFGRWEERLVSFAGTGVACKVDGRWKLTANGRALADHVAGELLGCL